jgi:hypothetical protein
MPDLKLTWIIVTPPTKLSTKLITVFLYTLAQDETAKNVATQTRTQIFGNIFALRSS